MTLASNTKTVNAVLVLVLLAQLGCSTSSMVSAVPSTKRLSFAEFNLFSVAAANQDVTIVFQDKSTLRVKGVRADADSTSWLDPATGMRNAAQTSLIKKVIFKHSAAGEGAGIGALIGAGMGLGGAIIHMAGDKSEFAGIALIVGPPIGAGVGAIVGVIIGVGKGHSDVYEFPGEQEDR